MTTNVKTQDEVFLKIKIKSSPRGTSQSIHILDGDGSIPDKCIFTYQLTLPNKTAIWKHRVKFVAKSTVAADYEYAAKKAAEKLFKDREKARQKR